MYDAVLAQLRDVIVPRTTDPLAQARGKGIARIIKYLARVDTYGPYYEECELQDLEKLLGRRPDSVASGRADAAAAVDGRHRVRRGLRPRRCGDGSPARRSWPVPRWACSPTGTGPRSGEPMTTLFGVDLDQRRAERTYRELVPADDDFHDEELTDRWWETETCWFSWNVPERNLGGWTYCQARPNANICNGGAWVWDDTAAYPWELAYRAEYSGLQLPPRAERDMRDFEWPNGVHVRVIEPLTTYAVRYSDPGALEVDLTSSRPSWRPTCTPTAWSRS